MVSPATPSEIVSPTTPFYIISPTTPSKIVSDSTPLEIISNSTPLALIFPRLTCRRQLWCMLLILSGGLKHQTVQKNFIILQIHLLRLQ